MYEEVNCGLVQMSSGLFWLGFMQIDGIKPFVILDRPAQTCSTTQEGDVRLTRTNSITLSNAGLVEVCHNGMWGTVCANSFSTPWSEKNAQVVCRQLGFSGALNSILQDT